MRVTIEGLRRWIVIAAGLLLAVVAGFFIYGRNRFRHIERDLPARLGVNIQQTATGFSYTQSSQGHPIFTLKASKLIQLKAGHALLHDVDITLYGPPGSGRQDRIYGSDFDYDQKDGIATSKGDVTIELQGMGTNSPPGSSGNPTGSNTIRVHTRGLTFVQKTGEASTAQPLEFQLPRAAGTSVGADYNSKTGIVVLNSQVHITSSSNGKAVVVQAAHATLLRVSMQALLEQATMNYQTETGSADHAIVDFRKDGTAETVDASGHVQMKSDTGATVTSDTARILLNTKSQPTQAVLGGGVQFASARPNASMQGSAGAATLLFATAAGSQTELRHAEFHQDVHFAETLIGLPQDPCGRTVRRLQAETVNLDFVEAPNGHGVEARRAVAEGNPVVTSHQTPSHGPAQTTRISGDRLVATLAAGNALRQLDGTGHTHFEQESTDGARSSSLGDALRVYFVQQPVPAPAAEHAAASQVVGCALAPAPRKPGVPAAPRLQTTLETAIQDGHVELTELPARKPGATAPPEPLTAWANHAEYRAADQVLHLTGNPRIAQGSGLQLAAQQVDYHRDTQNADAQGDVKATYTQPPAAGNGSQKTVSFAGNSSQPVHVVAARATLDHVTNVSTFYGSAQAPARMWQESDSLLAPVIAIDRDRSVLKAWGEAAATTPQVNANFVSTATGTGPRKEQPSLVRVRSRTLVYSDAARQADFSGSVEAIQGDERIHCDDALIFLKPSTKSAAGSAPPAKTAGTGQIDHVVATGHVVFTQPGRRGDGEKLVYTADNGRFVLTGTPQARPRLWDRDHGTTTGEALIFNRGDDSVEVSGGKSSAVTQTRARK